MSRASAPDVPNIVEPAKGPSDKGSFAFDESSTPKGLVRGMELGLLDQGLEIRNLDTD